MPSTLATPLLLSLISYCGPRYPSVCPVTPATWSRSAMIFGLTLHYVLGEEEGAGVRLPVLHDRGRRGQGRRGALRQHSGAQSFNILGVFVVKKILEKRKGQKERCARIELIE